MIKSVSYTHLKSGITDVVYNDFYVEDGANVTIIAGCGIHNSGCNDTIHDGIHAFHIGSNCNVTYEEKHYGEGSGTGGRILNPVTKIYMKENSVFNLDTVQIKGVDSTVRETEVEIGANSRIYVTEKLMTHDEQSAESNMAIALNGEGLSLIHIFEQSNPTLMIIAISACMAGAVCGDHCSPISDTTIMASAGAQCDHVSHVATQLPYAFTVAAVSFISYIVAGFTQSAWISLPFGIVLLGVVLLVIKKYQKKMQN